MADDDGERAYRTIDVGREGGVVSLALNRPDRLNAISADMLDELCHALAAVAADREAKVTVLQGRGRGFSAGFDLSAPRQSDGEAYGAADMLMDDLAGLERRMGQLLAVWDHPKPVIAAVHGHCRAAATILALLCDITVVAEDASIALSSVPLGAGYVESLWTYAVGPKRAKQISFNTGNEISGAEAARWGWANFAVPPDELGSAVAELARGIARNPTDVLRLKKAAINRVVERQGFRQVAYAGAETDALAHQLPSVRRLRQLIAAHGIKDVKTRFANGELAL